MHSGIFALHINMLFAPVQNFKKNCCKQLGIIS